MLCIFQRLISNIMEESSDDKNWKEVAALLSIVDHLTSYLPHHGEEFNQVHQWLSAIASDKSIGEQTLYIFECTCTMTGISII